jgi:hypothetical protein
MSVSLMFAPRVYLRSLSIGKLKHAILSDRVYQSFRYRTCLRQWENRAQGSGKTKACQSFDMPVGLQLGDISVGKMGSQWVKYLIYHISVGNI